MDGKGFGFQKVPIIFPQDDAAAGGDNLSVFFENITKNNMFQKSKRVFAVLFKYFGNGFPGKGFNALICIAVVWWLVCRSARDLTIPESETAAARILTASLQRTSFRLGVGLLILAGGDLLYRRWRWNRSMMMTPEEIRQEQREAEGKPEVKAVRNDLLRASRSRR